MFIASLLAQIAKTPKFDFTLDFMEDSDREKLKGLIESLTLLDENCEPF